MEIIFVLPQDHEIEAREELEALQDNAITSFDTVDCKRLKEYAEEGYIFAVADMDTGKIHLIRNLQEFCQ